MNTNFMRELRANRPLQKALLIGLFLIVFVWIIIMLFFRLQLEEIIGPFPLAAGPTATASQTPQPGVNSFITNTGIVTPIVRSTFTPRTVVPATVTNTRLSRATATAAVTATPTVRPTSTARPTQTRRPLPTATRAQPTNTSAPPATPIITIPTIVIPLPTIVIPTIVIPLPTIVIPTLDLPFP